MRFFFVGAALVLSPGALAAQDADVGTGTPSESPSVETASEAWQEPSDAELAEAQHSFELATTAYEGGDYETAAEEFQVAYDITHHPELLFNVYLAHERAGRPAEAAEALGAYLASAELVAEERTLLERRLERIRARAAARETTPPPVEELEDATLLASPIEASAGGSATSGAAPTAPPPSGGTPSMVGIGVLVAGGVLLLGFAVLAPLSEVEDQRLATTCGRDAGRTCSDTSTLTALNVAADVAWIGGAALAATGLVLVLALPPDRPSPTGVEVAVRPWAGPGGGGLSIGGRF